LFNGKNIALELFLAPRGLVTILLFFAIPSELSLGSQFQGVLLFVILISCIIMTISLISYKNKISQLEHFEKEEDSVVGDINEEEN
jgi:NhaP-type Na+/H+ or K+/H+ antiporter